jgi:hypothetical protein
VSNDCQTQTNQMLRAHKDYVPVEGKIVALVQPMEGKVEQSKLQALNTAFDQENKPVNELQNLKASRVCDAY